VIDPTSGKTSTLLSRLDLSDLRAEDVTGNRAGVENFSRWLTKPALLNTFADAGIRPVEVIDDCLEPNGPRIAIWTNGHA